MIRDPIVDLLLDSFEKDDFVLTGKCAGPGRRLRRGRAGVGDLFGRRRITMGDLALLALWARRLISTYTQLKASWPLLTLAPPLPSLSAARFLRDPPAAFAAGAAASLISFSALAPRLPFSAPA